MTYDVAIIGGGPAGSTAAALLRKYTPTARVIVLERERFPREHVGESQLPPIGAILHEMGCWDEVEGAGFPIKVGATFRWGREPDLWDLDFLPHGKLEHEARPAPYAGQRQRTAFQVDRAIYDDILLRHAQGLGSEVRQETKVVEVGREGDRVTGLRLADGTTVDARWYVDASGNSGTLRRALGVGIDCPAALRNVAAWAYWDDIEWAETIGNGGTRIQVLSLPFGWIWFIPIAPTRASVGLVTSAEHYKRSGRTLEELYVEALRLEPRVERLLAKATRRGQCHTTKDWSFLADRAVGENWFLVGEAVGFADPILSAGLTLTHTGARELAYTLGALLAVEHDPAWLKLHYEENQRARVRQHIRFADFWYASNGQFTDLQEQCQQIASDAGFSMSAAEAWRWIAQGGFANDVLGQAMIGGYDLGSVKQLTQRFLGEPATWRLNDVNVLRLDLATAQRLEMPYYRDGKVIPIPAFERAGKRLLIVGIVGVVAQLVEQHPHVVKLFDAIEARLRPQLGPTAKFHAAQAAELLLVEGWAVGTKDPKLPFLSVHTPDEGAGVHTHHDADG